MSEPLLRTESLRKSFRMGDSEISVLDGIDLRIDRGERVAIVGQSGVGKSTLLHILGTLDHPTSGRVWIDGEDVFEKDPAALAGLRIVQSASSSSFIIFCPNSTAWRT